MHMLDGEWDNCVHVGSLNCRCIGRRWWLLGVHGRNRRVDVLHSDGAGNLREGLPRLNIMIEKA